MATKTDKEAPHIVVRGGGDNFQQEITAGKHRLVADEPMSGGGGDAGPDPYDYLLARLGVCTSMTVGFYARRNHLPLENITVSLWHSRIYAEDCEECETKNGMLDRIDVEVEFTGALCTEQHTKLMEIAAKCPVHRTLTSEINIRLRANEKPPAQIVQSRLRRSRKSNLGRPDLVATGQWPVIVMTCLQKHGPQGRGYSGCFRSVVLPDRTRRTSDRPRDYAECIVGYSFP